MGPQEPYVKVDVENLSGEVLNRVEIVSANSITYAEHIKQGEIKHFIFYLAGEGSYTINATYANGKVKECAGGYIESGYELKNVIYSDQIKNQFNQCPQK